MMMFTTGADVFMPALEAQAENLSILTSGTNFSVADPILEFRLLQPIWGKCRAVCNGERHVKHYDRMIDTAHFKNLLLPFSPSMNDSQYSFYRAEAELPGIVAQYFKMIASSLLKEVPMVSVPDTVPADAIDWIMNDFGQDGTPLSVFIEHLLHEELQTSRAWVYVDYPEIENWDALTPEEKDEVKPYPILWKAEEVINWRMRRGHNGRMQLSQVVTRGFYADYSANEFHPKLVETISVHEINESGNYQIRVFQPNDEQKGEDGGRRMETADTQLTPSTLVHNGGAFKLVNLKDQFLNHGEPLRFIPAWPLNGSVAPAEPALMPLVNKEIALYNKISRRNHLLYGAATYTPIVKSRMTDEELDQMVGSGLGTWLRVQPDEDITIMKTPTEALVDMDRAIKEGIEDMAKLGVRMLTSESSQESGVALELRNASQTAQLGVLNTRVASTMKSVIAFMLSWRYGEEVSASQIIFKLSPDFDRMPEGVDWLKMATDWYQNGLIPRSVWISLLQENSVLPSEYDDTESTKEITSDELIVTPASQQPSDFAGKAKKGVL
jgi:hypothetical protein